MKRFRVLSIVVSVMVALVLVGCTPKGGLSVTSTPPFAATKTPGLVVTPNISPEESAWNEVVAAAKKEGVVTAYSYSWRGDSGVAISRAFQSKFGIKVEIITGRGSEFTERLKTEQRIGGMIGDLYEGASTHAVNLKKGGLTANIKGLPALKELNGFAVSPFVSDPEGHIVAYNLYFYTPYINTDLVKSGEEPKIWKDLLDPKWKGKMLFASPSVSMGAYMQFWPLKAEGVIDMEYLKALGKQDILWTTGMMENMAMLGRGEKPLRACHEITILS